MTASARRYNIDRFIKIARNCKSGTFAFKDIFVGFERLEAVRSIFSDKADQILSNLKIEVFPRQGFMGVSDEDGHIFASQFYINQGEMWSVYLDAVHELVHVKQFMDGRNLFDPAYTYVERPTEIEAYTIGVKEARRIGLSEQEIFDYLEVPWITKGQHLKLANSCNVMMDQVVFAKKGSSNVLTKKRG